MSLVVPVEPLLDDTLAVLAEFNSQIGSDYFSQTQGSFDALTIYAMPDNTVWPNAGDGLETLGMEDGVHVFLHTSAVLALQGRVRREFVVVHELGHILGLGHSSDRGNIMYPILTLMTVPTMSQAVSQVVAATAANRMP